MDPFEKEIAKAFEAPQPRSGPARILIVGGNGCESKAMVAELGTRGHRCSCVTNLAEARTTVIADRLDLLLLHENLASTEGIELTETLRRTSPWAKTILVSNDCTAELAVRAMRSGAIDVISLPADLEQIGERIDEALLRSRAGEQQEQRLTRLKTICDELNVARREISDQLDTLCTELVSAHEDTTRQLDLIEMTTEFRTMLRQELDVEELLRTTLEYMLSKTGPTNAAVFLPDENDHFSLGAYVNYDCPRESVTMLLDHLCEAVCPQMMGEQDIVSFGDAAEFAEWIGMESDFLADAQVLAFSCEHAGECLAIVVLFRSATMPFTVELGETIDILRTLFAEQLANVIRIHHRAQENWPTDMHDDDFDFGDGMAA